MDIYCKECGAVIPEGSNFCTECGVRVDDSIEIKLENDKKLEYEEAVTAMNEAVDEKSFRHAAELLEKFSGFEIADELYQECIEKAETFHKDNIYEQAIAKTEGKISISSCKSIIKLFAEIPGWKDADEQIEKYQNIQEELEVERKTKRKKNRKYFIIAGAIIVIIAAAVVAYMMYSEQQKQSEKFDKTVQTLNDTKTEFDAKLAEAQKKYDAGEGSKDALTALKGSLDAAKRISAPEIPEKASWTSDLKNQIAGIEKQISDYRNSISSMQLAIEGVNESIADQQKYAATITGSTTSTVKSNDGYEFKVTWTLGKWIKASDKAMIADAWKTLGGKGDIPYISKFGGYGGYTEDKAMILIGTCRFDNITSGYNISSDSDISVNAPISVKYTKPDAKRDSSSSAQILVDYTDQNTSSLSYGGGIRPKLTGNTWGPVAFAIAVPNVFVPNNEVSASNYFISFDTDNDFGIETSW